MFAFVNNIYGDKGTGRVVNWQKLIVFIMEQKMLLSNEWEEEREKD